ncbi:MAG: hypothetical protein H6765_06660 [Candidatus Peribacteria bacterium]|nr:MAG: hypothetical protein H6765_06660 [Candidatus Peribacteria bacterium]
MKTFKIILLIGLLASCSKQVETDMTFQEETILQSLTEHPEAWRVTRVPTQKKAYQVLGPQGEKLWYGDGYNGLLLQVDPHGLTIVGSSGIYKVEGENLAYMREKISNMLPK